MTLDESIKILTILKAAYPKDFPFNMSVEEAEIVATIWNEQFLNVPGAIVEVAVKKLIATEERCFSIAKVKKKIGGMYWEAKELLDADDRNTRLGLCAMNEQKKAFYEFIKKETEGYKANMVIEPSISELVSNETKRLLLGGGDNGNL